MMFEAKSYNDVRKTIAAANGIFAAAFLISAYLCILSPTHKAGLDTLLGETRMDPVVGSVITLALVGAVWGYLTTGLFSLHDRLYEPHFVSWRAAYDADFILRSLCFSYPGRVSPRLFDVAFTDPKARASLLQRLFYKFIGDSKTAHEELRERFYGLIRNYWLLVTAELYCIGFFLICAVYCLLAKPPVSPYHDRALLGSIVAAVLLRIWSNHQLPQVRPITVEQINAVLHEHRADFEAALDAAVCDYHLEP
jgi:hypothetical protein